MHMAELNDPLESLAKATVSPTIEPNAPETVAVQVVELPTMTLEGEQATEVVVVAWFTVTEAVPALPALFASPAYAAVIVCGEPDTLVGV